MKHTTLLSISIPTFNRAAYLKESLDQLQSELRDISLGLVEIYVSDNASTDQTAEVVTSAQQNGLSVRYVRNEKNIGSDANIAQCFNDALGKYVLIMGDDDLFVDGALAALVNNLVGNEYGLVCLRSYGFDTDFRAELPPSELGVSEFSNAGEYLIKVAHLVTLISACVINKSLLTGVNARQFCGGNLVQVHLCVMAALRAEKNLFVNNYQIAVKRNNSGGYDHSKVFVTNLLGILDGFIGQGLSKVDVHKVERRMLVSYLPFYIYRLLTSGKENMQFARANFNARFAGDWLYVMWLKPALYLPRPLAIAWSALITIVGRLLGGDLVRGLYYMKNALLAKLK
jgi:abequosyltransferase